MHSTKRDFCFRQMLCIGAVSLLALAGCASGPKTVEIKAVADPVINRDVSGKALSVVVHIYQLKDATEFTKLTFDMLASGRSLSEQLGKDLIEMSEVMLVPGATQSRVDKIHQDARHVGVVAFFREPDQHYWRLLVDADEVRGNGLNFRVQECFLSLATPKPALIPGQPSSPPSTCANNNVRPASLVAPPATASGRQNAVAANSKRSSGTGLINQAVDSLLTRKP